MTPAATLSAAVRRLWSADRPLTAVGLLMLPALALFLAGMLLDPREIAGAPAWMKPAKFAASIAIYSLTLAWIFSLLPSWPRTRRIVGRATAAVMLLEIGLIALQAWRGTTSHFNVATPADGAIFTVMGAAIVTQTLASVSVAIALWRQPFQDAALGWALRIGMIVTIAGALSGGLMTRPTGAQLAAARAGDRLAVAGAHTVGAEDGGPGLPVTGWSRDHGDLRVAHFAGLHALQALPIVAILARRRWRSPARARVVIAAGVSYAALVGILLWQALRGEPLAAPGALTTGVMAAWLGATLAGGRLAVRAREGSSGPAWARC